MPVAWVSPRAPPNSVEKGEPDPEEQGPLPGRLPSAQNFVAKELTLPGGGLGIPPTIGKVVESVTSADEGIAVRVDCNRGRIRNPISAAEVGRLGISCADRARNIRLVANRYLPIGAEPGYEGRLAVVRALKSVDHGEVGCTGITGDEGIADGIHRDTVGEGRIIAAKLG